MVPRMDTLALVPTVCLGASLRDRATLSSPLRGLAPSGGYPSRLRSLRSLRAPLAWRLAALAAATARHGRGQVRRHRPPDRRVLLAPALRAALVAVLAVFALAGCAGCGHRPGFVPVRSVSRRCRLRRAPALGTAPCSGARTGADSAAIASGSVLRTTACGSGRTARRSSAAAASTGEDRRRRFPYRECRPMRSLLTAGRLILHTPRIDDAFPVSVRHRALTPKRVWWQGLTALPVWLRRPASLANRRRGRFLY